MIVNKATRRPLETLYQPCYGGVIKRAGIPFLTAYLHRFRNEDRVPATAAEAGRLMASLVTLDVTVNRLNAHELRYGVED